MRKTLIIVLAAMLVLSALVVSCNADNVYIDDNFYCTVKYDANGGSGKMEDQVIVGPTGELAKNTFIRTDYNFVGWNTKADGSGTSYEDQAAIKISQNITLYAQWSHKTVVVTFHANGGEGAMEAERILTNTPTPLTHNSYTKTNFVFASWNTKADGTGISYAASASVSISTSMDLYAQWSPVTLALTFHANGGEGEMDPQVVSYGQSVAIDGNEYTREGYVFAEWNTRSDGEGTSFSDEETIIPYADLDLYAIWEDDGLIRVYYMPNGGMGQAFYDDATADEDYDLLECTFTKDGYDFVGWALSADGEAVYEDRETIDLPVDDFSLYAVWEEHIDYVTVKFFPNGGEGEVADQEIEAEVETELNANGFTYEGYTFVGWNTATDGSGDSYEDEEEVTLTSDLNLYAIWEEDIVYYTVTFNANGGEGEMADQEIEAEVETELNANGFIYEGHSFVGWNTAADGSGDSYEDEEEVVLTSDLILYAIWEEEIDLTGGWSGSGISLVVNADGSLVMNDGKRNYEGSHDPMFLYFESSGDSPLDCEYYVYLNSAATKAYANDGMFVSKTDAQINSIVSLNGHNADVYPNNVVMHLDTGSETVEHTLIYGYFPDGTGGFESCTEHHDPETGDVLYAITEFVPFEIGYPAEPGQQFYLCIEEPGSINYITSAFLYSYDPVEDEIHIPFLHATLERVLPE